MEKHQFKVIYSNEDDVYRILDLTDTSIVGITEMYETEYDRVERVETNKALKTKKGLGAKVINYGIFIRLDEDNMQPYPKSDEAYLRRVLHQMAVFFKETEIDPSPDYFKEYFVPSPKRQQLVSQKKAITISENKHTESKPSKRPKWLRGWRLALLIVLLILLIGFIVSLIVFPSFREAVSNVITIILGLPFLIIMFIAYADDMFARR